MRRYRSHKIVEAGVITAFANGLPDGLVRVAAPGQGRDEEIVVPPSFFARGEPALGDYLVRYEDGYLSWSPKKAFEEGYTAVD